VIVVALAVAGAGTAVAAEMTGPEIKAAFSGKNTSFRTADGKFTGKALYKPDGTSVMSGANLPVAADDTGKWRVKGNQFCSSWKKNGSGQERCVTFTKQPDGSLKASNGNITIFE
jgi:hypothetical protein